MNPIDHPELYKFLVVMYSAFSLVMFGLILFNLKVKDDDELS
jgi:hypothetical protein